MDRAQGKEMFCGPETVMFVMAVERPQKISFHEGLTVNKCFIQGRREGI